MNKQSKFLTARPMEESEIRKIWHNQEWYFSIVDVVSWATGRNYDAARKYWKNLKAELKAANNQLVSNPYQLKMKAVDGKLRETDAGTAEQILRIIQEIPGVKTNEVKDWLARVGAERLEETHDPEGFEEQVIIQDMPDTEEARRKRRERRIEKYKAMGRDEAWIATREFGIITRREFTVMIKELLGNRANYGQLTNDVYRGVHHRDTNQLRNDLNIGRDENPRDYMHRIGLHYVGIAEEACQIKLGHLLDTDPVPPTLVRDIIMVSKQIGVQADELALALGIDIVTGKSLLKSRSEA